MRYSMSVAMLASLALLVACEKDPNGPDSDLDPLDTAQVRGTLLVRDALLANGSKLEWIPETELVAFTASLPGYCSIRTLDAAAGSTNTIDSDCNGTYSFYEHYFRRLAAASDGGLLYYTVGLGDVIGSESQFPLRVADPTGGAINTLRIVGWETSLAVSPDGHKLAFVTNDSLIVRDLSSGVETHYADLHFQAAGPIVFSPDATELLYEMRDFASLSRTLHRLSLEEGVDELVSLPEVTQVRLIHWDVSGIAVLAQRSSPPDYIPEYHVLNLSTGESVSVGGIQRGEGVPYELLGSRVAWSLDGSRVAYWVGRCVVWGEPIECAHERWALFVAEAGAGTRERVAYVPASGPMVFSPDGTRIVYHLPDGNLYLVDVL